MEIVFKLKLCADGKVELSHDNHKFAKTEQSTIKHALKEWNDLVEKQSQYNEQNNSWNRKIAINGKQQNLYTITETANLINWYGNKPKAITFKSFLIQNKYIIFMTHGSNGNLNHAKSYYKINEKYNDLFYKRSAFSSVYVTEKGLSFFKNIGS